MNLPRLARGRRRPGQDAADSGVSSIVAAVLLLALFTTAFTLWSISTLPGWIADREEAHAQGTEEAFRALQASAEALSASDDVGPSSVTVDLGASRVPVLQRVSASGELGMAGSVRWQADFTGEGVLVANGATGVLPTEAVTDGTGDTLAGVYDLEALVVFLETEGLGNKEMTWVDIVATDADGKTVQARFVHETADSGNSDAMTAGCRSGELRLEVTSTTVPAIDYTQALLCSVADRLTGYTIDLARDFFPFKDGLDGLEAPYTIHVEESDGRAQASFGAVYVDSDGASQGVGSGTAGELALDETSAVLGFDPGYQQFAGPGPTWELGGLVLEQADGMAVASSRFDLAVDGPRGTLDWTVVVLGGSDGQAGDGPVSVQVRHASTRDVLLTAGAADFTVASDHAAAWRSFLEDRVLLAGAEDSATVSGSGTAARLQLGGAVTEWTIHLRVIRVEVAIA